MPYSGRFCRDQNRWITVILNDESQTSSSTDEKVGKIRTERSNSLQQANAEKATTTRSE